MSAKTLAAPGPVRRRVGTGFGNRHVHVRKGSHDVCPDLNSTSLSCPPDFTRQRQIEVLIKGRGVPQKCMTPLAQRYADFTAAPSGKPSEFELLVSEGLAL